MEKVFAVALIFVSFFIASCKDKVTVPEDKPGRRDYTWKADTLFTEWGFGVTDMWGSSPNDIWLTAAGTTGFDCLWHYDGQKWQRHNQYLNPALGTVFGITNDEIWIGDWYGGIWRNVGNGWEKFQDIKVDGFDYASIGRIYGTSKDDLYAVGFADHYDGSGYKGIIVKYDGKEWRLLNIPDIKIGFERIKKLKSGKFLIAGSMSSESSFLQKLFVFDGASTLKEIYSGYYSPVLFERGGDVYITINMKIYKCNDNELVLWKELTGNVYYRTPLIRNEKDIFCGSDEGILHFNGTDLVNLYKTYQLEIGGELIFEKDVFFYGDDPAKNLNVIIRGTLKE